MRRLGDQYGAVDLSNGMPDFDPPSQLTEAAVEAIRSGKNQYSPSRGQRRLREALALKVKEYNGIDADPDKNITITCGSTEAVTAAVFALTDPSDQVVIADPFYENYLPDAIIAGCKTTFVPFIGRDLLLDEERLKKAMAKRPKLIILNTPNNPTGRVLDAKQLKLIADLCEDVGTIAIVDEIYEHITYDGKRHISLATIGNMHERTVTVSGASKTYSVTGWRVGWAIAEAKLSAAIQKVHDYLTVCAPTPFQEALVRALGFPSSYYEKLAKMYDKKRRQVMKFLDEASLEYYRPEGSYYVLVNAPAEFKDAQEFTDHLLRNVGIAVLPANALYHDKGLGSRKIRIAYCKKDTTLQEAARRLMKLVSKRKVKLAARTEAGRRL